MPVRCVQCGYVVAADPERVAGKPCPKCQAPLPKAGAIGRIVGGEKKKEATSAQTADPFGLEGKSSKPNAHRPEKAKGAVPSAASSQPTDPFGLADETPATSTVSQYRRPSQDDSQVAIYSALGIFAFLVVAVLLVMMSRSKRAEGDPESISAAERRQEATVSRLVQDSKRNFAFRPPTPDWKRRAASMDKPGVLEFERTNPNAQIAIIVDTNWTLIPSSGQLRHVVVTRWNQELAAPAPPEVKEVTVAGVPAQRLATTGEVGGVRVRRQSYVFFSQGIAYELQFSASEVDFPRVEQQFATAVNQFELLEDRPNWKAELRGLTDSFSGKKFDYRLHLPARIWEEASHLEGSPYDDLKLQDRKRNGFIFVAPFQASDVEDLRKRYLATKQKRHPEGVEFRPPEETLVINGLAARRMRLVVRIDGGELFLMTTFIQAGEWTVRIECEAPAEMRVDYEPVFSRLVESFEVPGKSELGKTQVTGESAASEMPTELDPTLEEAPPLAREAAEADKAKVVDAEAAKEPTAAGEKMEEEGAPFELDDGRRVPAGSNRPGAKPKAR